MPSGRGGSRTGSSRSGGSSHTSSSRSSGGWGGSSSSHSGGGNRTTVFIGGGYGRRGYYGGRNTMSGVGAFCVIAFIVMLIGVFMLMGANTTQKTIETDMQIYQGMIVNAQSDVSGALVREATQIRHMKNDKGDKWWFEYTIVTKPGLDGTNVPQWLLEGRSLPIYDYDQLPWETNSKVWVAIAPAPIGDNTDSVPMSHQNGTGEIVSHLDLTSVAYDADYQAAEGTKSLGTTLAAVGGALFGILLLASIGLFSFLRKKKPATADAGNTGSQVSNSGAMTSNSTQTQSTIQRCPYCQAKIDAGDKRCTNCGAKV